MKNPELPPSRLAIIGAGPAGLMAAERIATAGYQVEVFDAMPSVARKFLLAGVGGMNITHSEDYPLFVQRYREASPALQPMLDAFPPAALRQWIHDLGIDTFVGSSGRVFPTDMKAAPLLRRWLQRLRQQGVVFHPRQRWIGWQQDEQGLCWQFRGPDGEHEQRFSAVVLALGGASWPKLGSDGRWVDVLQQAGVAVTPLQASNCGFELPWSDYLRERFAGTPVKHIRLSLTNSDGSSESKTGEFVITDYGVEGSLVYALSAPLRQRWQQQPEQARLILDWLPHSSLEQISAKLQQPRKGMSFANVLRKKLHLPPLAGALLKECCPHLDPNDSQAVAAALKAMPLPAVTATRPITEAISCAGGVQFAALTPDLMLKELPGVFAAGEMLDWEAPTGGYLLTACFATGRYAGDALLRHMQQQDVTPNTEPAQGQGLE